MRDLERVLTATCFAGSLAAGIVHASLWLVLPPLAFAALLVAEDRAVHRQIGNSHWPSMGYARFVFGTNLYRLGRNTVLSGAIFAIASGTTSLLGR